MLRRTIAPAGACLCLVALVVTGCRDGEERTPGAEVDLDSVVAVEPAAPGWDWSGAKRDRRTLGPDQLDDPEGLSWSEAGRAIQLELVERVRRAGYRRGSLSTWAHDGRNAGVTAELYADDEGAGAVLAERHAFALRWAREVDQRDPGVFEQVEMGEDGWLLHSRLGTEEGVTIGWRRANLVAMLTLHCLECPADVRAAATSWAFAVDAALQRALAAAPR